MYEQECAHSEDSINILSIERGLRNETPWGELKHYIDSVISEAELEDDYRYEKFKYIRRKQRIKDLDNDTK